jgi:hypothetical protein
VGVLVLAGGGAGTYFAMKGGSSAKVVASGSGSAQADGPDNKTPEPPDTGSAAAAGGGDDPWADDGKPSIDLPNRPSKPGTDPDDDPPDLLDPPDLDDPPTAAIGTALMPIPKGASLTVPAGFTKMAETDQLLLYRKNASNETIAMAPLIAGTNDPRKLAARYASDTGAKLEDSDTVDSAGEQRTVMMFSSQTDAGPMIHIVAIYLAPAYRVGVLYVTLAANAAEDGFEANVERFFRNGVHLP